ncbi:MAG: hypothetical protein KIH03_11630 [Paludibacteraceae bacterium]|nr:hypothetical protein [Paludibacteraceae bacterium]
MKKIILFILSMLAFISIEAKTVFAIEGPERSYNHIKVVNCTSQNNFSCKFVSLSKNRDGSFKRGEEYGTYHFNGHKDEQKIIAKIKRESLIGIETPVDFPVDIEVTISYVDHRFYDYVVVVLYDKNSVKYDSF